MNIFIRGAASQMVRAIKGGATWDEVRVSHPALRPEWVDENLKAWVLLSAGVVPPAPADAQAPEKRKKGKR
jgi:hypothetical protein